MIEINSLANELIEESKLYNQDLITKDELNLKLELVKNRLHMVEINYDFQPFDTLPEHVKNTFNALLNQARYKSILGIKSLQEAKGKRSYNYKLRQLIGNKLYFRSLYTTLRKNASAYVHRNQLQFHNLDSQIFILAKDGNENE